MVNYIIIHNTHNGCYDFQCYQDEAARIRLTSITINPPKIYLFNTRDEAQDFFEEYINDVDCIDIKCKKGDDVEHVDYCTCGVIELDETGEPILFYNKKNQIFLMEHGPQVFIPHQELKNDIKNLNLTNKLIRKCKSLGREQRNRYIELGKYCEECNDNDEVNSVDENSNKETNVIIEEKIEPTIEPKKEVIEKTNIVTKKRVYKKKDTTQDKTTTTDKTTTPDKTTTNEESSEKKKKTTSKKSKNTTDDTKIN
jgi:hypothetical protein